MFQEGLFPKLTISLEVLAQILCRVVCADLLFSRYWPHTFSLCYSLCCNFEGSSLLSRSQDGCDSSLVKRYIACFCGVPLIECLGNSIYILGAVQGTLGMGPPVSGHMQYGP